MTRQVGGAGETVSVRLLGPPSIERGGRPLEPPRGHKTWGLLALLALSQGPVSRRRAAELLFAEANDPLRALRWSLTELRRVMGLDEAALGGDPLELRLEASCRIDALRLAAGELPDRESGHLLEGLEFDGLAGFQLWLAGQRQHLVSWQEALLRDRALAAVAVGRGDEAILLAQHALALNPLDSRNHEVLVRSLVAVGRTDDARAQVARCADLFRRELGVPVPDKLRAAAEGAPNGRRCPAVATEAEVAAQLEVGCAAMEAGAAAAGLDALRRAEKLASDTASHMLQARAILALGGALVQCVAYGDDAELLALIHRGLAAAELAGSEPLMATGAMLLSQVAVNCGNPGHCAMWADRAERHAGDDDALMAEIAGLRGMALSDQALYAPALRALEASVERGQRAGRRRQAAWSLGLVARIHFLRGDLELAIHELDACLAIVSAERWTAFRPWPLSLRGEALVRLGADDRAHADLEQAYALAREMDDACWLAASGRALAIAASLRGRSTEAARWAERSLEPMPPYLWLRGFALDAACTAFMSRDPARARSAAQELTGLAERGGFRELAARAALHRAALGVRGASQAARALVVDIDNQSLHRELQARS